ncbi:hypothetical protein JTE90_022948 [Oedothorax gibbosus]|uniref:Uncharacterized protein n=1 Tax=Oedothorax gibbosus TaxID=931172 RepID=A0AAV6TDD9_9ARAC|nr:hypothetical protein JTE90_022948 [Oedothorax gibbosus]
MFRLVLRRFDPDLTIDLQSQKPLRTPTRVFFPLGPVLSGHRVYQTSGPNVALKLRHFQSGTRGSFRGGPPPEGRDFPNAAHPAGLTFILPPAYSKTH